MSPVKSKAQWHKIWQLVRKGKLTKAQAEEMVRGVNYDELPEKTSKSKRGRR